MEPGKKILQSFADAYEIDGFPPLAGKIMGVFYLSEKEHLSFEEIIQQTEASKGAVSKSLNQLIQLKRVNYVVSEESHRKRLFYLDTKGIIHFVKMMINNYKQQDALLRKCLVLRNDKDSDLYQFIENSIAFNADVLATLDEKADQYFKK